MPDFPAENAYELGLVTEQDGTSSQYTRSDAKAQDRFNRLCFNAVHGAAHPQAMRSRDLMLRLRASRPASICCFTLKRDPSRSGSRPFPQVKGVTESGPDPFSARGPALPASGLIAGKEAHIWNLAASLLLCYQHISSQSLEASRTPRSNLSPRLQEPSAPMRNFAAFSAIHLSLVALAQQRQLPSAKGLGARQL